MAEHMQLVTTTYQSPYGPLRLLAGDSGLLRIDFAANGTGQSAWAERLLGPVTITERKQHALLQATVAQLMAYFENPLQQFDVQLDLRGSEFQLLVWNALLKIPAGETRTYAELAETIGQPKAVRALAAANAANPIAIIVPCHRVIGSDGSLRGYGGGMRLKQQLLDNERSARTERQPA